MGNRWLSVKEFAAYLGVNRDTIYKGIDRKNRAARKVGRLWMFKKDQIDEWVNAGRAAHDDSEGTES